MREKRSNLALIFGGLAVLFLSGALAFVSAQTRTDADLAETIRRMTNRSTAGLVDVKHPDGGVSVDLEERFQYVMLSRLNAFGEPVVGCVTSLGEANAFFGRDLETGRVFPNFTPLFEDLEQQAAQHGLTAREFLFYKDMIERSAELNSLTATISIVNNDGPGEGFNDPTPATPEGGNTGTTLGQQRLNLFNQAAGIWGAFLDSTVQINVRSQFDPLPCTPTSATLGGAGTTTVHRDFPGAQLAGTWYHQALANKQSGSDRSAQPDINATFNSNINGSPTCLGSRRFYLGYDNSTPPGTTNLLIVLLHEMGHGLGFADFTDPSNGTLFNGFPDIYTTYMFDRTTSKFWNNMTNSERMASAINPNNVMWDGPSIKLASGTQTGGRDATNGRLELYTPNPVEDGSSVSHWNTSASPNLLMEPFITLNLPLDLDLTRQLMRDIGWSRDSNADAVPDTITNVTPSGGTVVIGTQQTVTWNNTGGFNKNVTIELSTDGGATFPTNLATNIANTGSFLFTVPNMPTIQAKIRVREFNFAAPSGVSSANFRISTTPAPRRPIFDFDGDSKTDVSIFRPAPGEWWYLRSSDLGNNAFQFGQGSDQIVPADYTGDGKTDIAFFRPSNSEWFVLRSEDASFYSFPFGASGDIPVPGDFDGDGKADPAIFRPSNSTWYILNSGGGTTITPFGANGDRPVAADYDGDSKADIAIFRPSDGTWWINRSASGLIVYNFGTGTDKAVPADYTGDGKTDVAFFRPSSSEWFILRSEDTSFFSFPFGTSGDIPVPGDYDGDGKADPAVFRPSNNTWFLLNSTSGFSAVTFGASGDKPLPNAYVR